MSAPSLVLGTAGHIDHGKTSLIQALTGTDTDRLAAEKERGITIELGFARLDLPSGRSMGVVDVPGHERFVRQMVAGATGIDAVLLVVAADDGVMPQTREHLAIIDLLGVSAGVVAITKGDLAEPDMLDLVREEIDELLEGTVLEGAHSVVVSSKTGDGLDELLVALDEVASETHAGQRSLPLRLPVDRVFTIAGAGTVVTGTMWSGTARKDDRGEILPSGREARVRSVQVHSESVERAVAGQRVALNLVGVEKSEVARGDIVAAPGTLTITDRLDATFTYLASEERPFETDTRVHVHHGTREVVGRILLMGAEHLSPGDTMLAQIRLEAPLAPRYGDRYIVRSFSPMWTIGGGEILDVHPPRRTTLSDGERSLLDALIAHDIGAAAVRLVISRGVPMTSAEVAASLGVTRSEVADALNRAGLARLKAGGETYFVPAEVLEGLVCGVETHLLAFHEEQPKATGIASRALKDRVAGRLSPRLFDVVLEMAVERGSTVLEGGSVRHPKAAVSALAEQERAQSGLARLLADQGLTPASVAELASEAGVDQGVAHKALNILVVAGEAVKVGSDLYFHAGAVGAARESIVAYLGEHGTILAKDARDLLGTSRKYVVPLLEYFDAQGVTKRQGDERVLKR